MTDRNATKIFVSDFQIDALAGIYPGDDVKPTLLSITVEANFRDHRIESDAISSTLSYELIADEIRILSKRHFHLVETMAEHLAEFCLSQDRISSVRVRIEKPRIFPEGKAGTEIFRVKMHN